MKYKWLYLLISALVIIPGVISLVSFGLKLGIDFTGGSRYEIEVEKPLSPEIISKVYKDRNIEISSVVIAGSSRILIKSKFIDENIKDDIKSALEREAGRVSELRFEAIGPLLGKELLIKTLVALVLASLLILSYIAWQFRNWSFGVCATLATLHDALVVVGSFSILGRFFNFEIDILFVTALLTILSFSVHDTIVTYDRVRESAKRSPGASFEILINRAVGEMLVRSLNNSLTVIFMLVSLIILGGSTIRQFAIALLIGTISGTYSSLFTAAPLLAIWKGRGRV